MAMTEHQKWLIGTVVVPIVTFFVGSLLTLFGIFVTVAINEDARQEREFERAENEKKAALAEAADRPILQMLAHRFDDGALILTLGHPSKSRTANIHDVEYTVTDRAALAQIRAKVPLDPQRGDDIGAANQLDNLVFKHGQWELDEFVFRTRVGLNVPPGAASDIRLIVTDPRLVGVRMNGELQINYSASAQFAPPMRLRNVVLIGKSDTVAQTIAPPNSAPDNRLKQRGRR